MPSQRHAPPTALDGGYGGDKGGSTAGCRLVWHAYASTDAIEGRWREREPFPAAVRFLSLSRFPPLASRQHSAGLRLRPSLVRAGRARAPFRPAADILNGAGPAVHELPETPAGPAPEGTSSAGGAARARVWPGDGIQGCGFRLRGVARPSKRASARLTFAKDMSFVG